MAVRTHAPRAIPLPVAHGLEEAVSEVRLGCRAKPGHRAAGREPVGFRVVHVRGMDQAPCIVDREVIEQIVHGPAAAPGHAVVHFLRLFRDMDMHPALRVHPPEPGKHLVEKIFCHRA